MNGYRCATCGEWHDGLPLAYSSDRPASWYDVPADRVDADVLLSSDECVIADRFFFIRGNIEIPIIGSTEKLSWGVWVSLSEENFQRHHELWNEEGRERMIPPMFGWLNTALQCYPNTLSLKTNVHVQPVGIRPLIELEQTGHPLAVEQRDGINWKRVEEIASALMHP